MGSNPYNAAAGTGQLSRSEIRYPAIWTAMAMWTWTIRRLEFVLSGPDVGMQPAAIERLSGDPMVAWPIRSFAAGF